MRVIIAGSRGLGSADTMNALESSGWKDAITEVVCGKADGPDSHGEMWAQYHGIPVEFFPADWGRYGKAAGPLRNTRMAEYASKGPERGALMAVWDGKSAGTAHMITAAIWHGLWVYVYRPQKGD